MQYDLKQRQGVSEGAVGPNVIFDKVDVNATLKERRTYSTRLACIGGRSSLGYPNDYICLDLGSYQGPYW